MTTLDLPNLKVIENPAANALLARVRGKISRDEARRLVRILYSWMMVEVVNRCFPTREVSIPTSMADSYGDDGVWHGTIPKPATQVVVLNIPRAGIVPAESVHDTLALLGIENVRADVMMMNRVSSPTDGHVTGVAVQGYKTGSSVQGAVVLYPDCMIATGASLLEAQRHYERLGGQALQHIVMALISAPRGLEAIAAAFPDTLIYTYAVDFGLTATDYILPGAGDMGEKLNGPSDACISQGVKQQ